MITGLMIVAQFCGAFLGVMLGYLALIDATWASDRVDARSDLDEDARVP